MTKTRIPTAHIAPFGLRMQEELKSALEAKAQANGRSLNAEIIARLQQSLGCNEGASAPDRLEIDRLSVAISNAVCDEIKRRGAVFFDPTKLPTGFSLVGEGDDIPDRFLDLKGQGKAHDEVNE